MSLELKIQSQLLFQLKGEPVSQNLLNNSLRLLSKWRSVLIQNTLLKNQGTTVMQGPLAGMDFLPQSAEGYYAVGMARRMPSSQVLAFDLNPKAQEVCTALAQKNEVSDRVKVSALFKPEDFANYANQKVLVLCDIEGAEKDLLDPELAPALKGMDLIVESHECLISGITQTLINRFKESHQITLVQDSGQRQLKDSPQWFNNLAHLDQLLATWEWRSGATPWLVMKAR